MAVSGPSQASYRVSLPGVTRTTAAVPRPTGSRAADAAGAGARGPDGVGVPTDLGDAERPQGIDSFGDAVRSALDAVQADVSRSDDLVAKTVRGESVETHQLMMALEKADLSVRLMTQVGRRAVDAYREIMRMNV